nr:MAG TPA: hypothetical protein [Caudoviricetes sp.]
MQNLTYNSEFTKKCTMCSFPIDIAHNVRYNICVKR